MTQSFIVSSFASYLRENGWKILYEDYVDGRRSGRGAQGAINYCFEAIFDQFPDIVAAKETRMLIVEADLTYKCKYVDKLRSFESRKHELLECANRSLNLGLTTLDLGMVFQRAPNALQARELRGFHVWWYSRRAESFILNKTVPSTFFGKE